MNKMDEVIVVCPRTSVFGRDDALAFQGVLKGKAAVDQVMEGVVSSTQLRRRGDAEEDPTYKQPIPYVALSRYSSTGELEVFVYKRLVGGGEQRLHHGYSIGVGGHMNTLFSATDYERVLLDEAGRELTEELVFTQDGKEVTPDFVLNVVGLINDDANEVGRVHIGILLSVTVQRGLEVAVRETEQLEGHWISLAELDRGEIFPSLERWSQYAVEALREG